MNERLRNLATTVDVSLMRRELALNELTRDRDEFTKFAFFRAKNH
jgi:hypothetical protein